MMMSKAAFSTGALYLLDTVEAMRQLRLAGFEHAELMPQCMADLEIGTLDRIIDLGMHISSIHYPLAFFSLLYNANPSMIREGRAYADKMAAFARKAGTEFVVIHPESEYQGQLKAMVGERITENIRYLCAALKESGVTVAMENYPAGAGQKPESLDAYVKALNISNMSVMVDTTEVIEGGEDPFDFISRLEKVPCHLHMSDFANGTKHLPIGMGDIDWKSLVALLKKREYKGYYTLEPSYRYYLDDLASKLKRDYEYITSLL